MAYGGVFEYAFSYSVDESYSDDDQTNGILANYDVIIEVSMLGPIISGLLY